MKMEFDVFFGVIRNYWFDRVQFRTEDFLVGTFN
jgi:hypothetical protein